jgi:hypothetical protein
MFRSVQCCYESGQPGRPIPRKYLSLNYLLSAAVS